MMHHTVKKKVLGMIYFMGHSYYEAFPKPTSPVEQVGTLLIYVPIDLPLLKCVTIFLS